MTRVDSERIDPPSPDREAALMARQIGFALFGVQSEPERIGRFELIRMIGEGGMGEVYLCRDPKLDREVAVKLLHRDIASERGRARLEREARTLASLSHPNVVPLFEVGEVDGQMFLAMEYVEGTTLGAWLRERAPDWREVVEVFLQAAEGLAAAHVAGLVHRDFKPDNVRIGSDGRVRVLDFGLARATGKSATSNASSSSGDPSAASTQSPQQLTRPGATPGTPAYMSPEQLDARAVDARSDQWSFCVALWEALYGCRPFEPKRLLERGNASPPLQKGESRGPRSLRRTLLRGLSLDPTKRWVTTQALALELRRSLRPRWPWVAAAGGLAAGAVVLMPSTDAPACNTQNTRDVWGEDVRAAVIERGAEQGLRTSVTWTADRLDAYVASWVAASEDACDASGRWSAARTTDTRACLDEGLDQLGLTVDALRDEPQTALRTLHDDGPTMLLDGLRDPARCLRAESSAQPSSETLALLAGVRRARLSGELPRARDLAARARVVAAENGSVEGIVIADRLRGRLDVELGWAERGIDTLLDAVQMAEGQRMDREAAWLWILLTDAAFSHAHDAARGKQWLERAQAAVTRLGDPTRPHVEVLRLDALGMLIEGEHDEALRVLDTALASARSMGPSMQPRVERLLIDRGNVRLEQGDPTAALKEFEQARDQRATRVGAAHASMAAISIALGRAHWEAEALEQAAAHFRDALETIEASYGPTSPRLSSALAGLTGVHLWSGNIEAAKKTARRTAEIQASLPPTHPERGGGLAALAQIEAALGNSEEAATLYAQAADAKSGLPNPAQRREAVNNAGWRLLRVGRWKEARSYYEWLRLNSDEDSQDYVFALAGLGRASDLGGSPKDAVASLELALPLAKQLTSPHPALVPEIQWHLAAALAQVDEEHTRAKQFTEDALDAYQSMESKDEVALADLQRLTQLLEPTPTTNG